MVERLQLEVSTGRLLQQSKSFTGKYNFVQLGSTDNTNYVHNAMLVNEKRKHKIRLTLIFMRTFNDYSENKLNIKTSKTK